MMKLKFIKSKKLISALVVAFVYVMMVGLQERSRMLAAHQELIDSVMTVDDAALKNVRATMESAHSWIDWSISSIKRHAEESTTDSTITVNNLQTSFQVTPLSATVDRRPLIVKKQMMDDDEGLHSNGELLGCAVTGATFVSDVADVHLESGGQPRCDVCFQFSNREDRDNFVPDMGYDPLQGKQESSARKCFAGKAAILGREDFIEYQLKFKDFDGFGYPYTVDCLLPNGIKELTCREISKMQSQIDQRDDIQAIYFQTRITMDGKVDNVQENKLFVHTNWSWSALMSHDDDRSKIASELPRSWDDVDSKYVPTRFEHLSLAQVEGPLYDQTTYHDSVTLKSMLKYKHSNGGVHTRLLVSLFHLIRNGPGATHIIAVVDGQLNRTIDNLHKLLDTKVSTLYPKYGEAIAMLLDTSTDSPILDIIPISQMDADPEAKPSQFLSDLTLAELLRQRQIKILVVPLPRPSIAFERSVCGGQYSFAQYLTARYAADFQVMMYADGDTAMVEHAGNNQTLQQILFNRFFSSHGSGCVGHRVRLIEQYVEPDKDSTEKVLQCTHDLATDKAKWQFAIDNCHLAQGNTAGRTDSIYAFNVHHPDTIAAYVPEGVRDCITGGTIETDPYFLKDTEFVELHLRNRMRKPECSC